MAAAVAGKFVSALHSLKGTNGRLALRYTPACVLFQSRNYAARKGTREKARKKKVKVEVKKQEFIPHNQRGLKQKMLTLDKVRTDDSWKHDLPADNVWIGKYYKWKVYSFEEAVQCHKETHQLGMFDAPDAFMKAMVELDMTGPKPSRPVTKFSRIIAAPHPYDHGENRNIVVFCKTPEMQTEAKNAGATVVGGPELISSVQASVLVFYPRDKEIRVKRFVLSARNKCMRIAKITGDLVLSDYEYVLAHPNIMAELIVIKGLLKKKFPSPGAGSLGGDIPGMVNKFLHGIKYSGCPHERQPLYGIAEFEFGRLNMDTKKLEENLVAVIDNINANRPKRKGPFITRIRLLSAPSKETLKINHEIYMKEEFAGTDDFDDDEEEGVAAAI